MVTQMDNMINNKADFPKWMTAGNTILYQKDPGKGNAVNDYWPILYLPLTWKLMTKITCNSVYEYLMYNLLEVEQKGYKKNSPGTKDQLLLNKMMLNNRKRRHTNLGMSWIDYKKAYNPAFLNFGKSWIGAGISEYCGIY